MVSRAFADDISVPI